MKTLALKIATLILLIGIGSAYAGKPVTQSIYEKFKNNVQYPESAVKQGIEGYVDVIFVVSDEGDILIKSAYSPNPELEKLLKEQLQEINCKDIRCKFNEHFKVRFDFKLIG